MDLKKLAIFTALITVFNLAWLYGFSKISIQVSDTFNITKIMSLMTMNTLLIAFATGLLMSAAIFTLILLSKKAEKKEMLASVTLASLIPFVLIKGFYSQATELAFMLVFYTAGLAMVSLSSRKKNTNLVEKMKTGWYAAKKVTTTLAVGGLLLGITVTSLNMQEYQQITKQSIIEMTMSAFENMDLSAITEEAVTMETIEKSLTDAYGESFSNLPEEQKQTIIEEAYSAAIEKSSEQKAIISGEIIEKTIDSVPFIKIFFNYLHLLIGLTIMTVVLTFGEIILTPLTAIMSAALTSDEKIKPRDFSAEKFAGLPFSYQERKRIEEEQRKENL